MSVPLTPMDLLKFSDNPHLLGKVNLAANIDKTILRVKPKGDSGSPSFECSFSTENELMANETFSEGVMQLFEGYEPAWFQANWFFTLWKTLQIEDEFHQK